MREDSPCKDCTEKFTACHGNCPKDARGEFGYNAWKARDQAQKEYTKKNRYRMYIPPSEARDKKRRHYIKHPVKDYKGGGSQ